MTVEFPDLLARFTAAIEAGDGMALAALFREDGIYTDTFYGAFTGRAAIRDMLETRFYGDGERFLWDMYEPVFDGAAGYARWLFSYTSRMEDSVGRRVVFDGMSRFEMVGGMIRHYDEIFNSGLAFVQLGMAPARTEKLLLRAVDELRQRPGAARHFSG